MEPADKKFGNSIRIKIFIQDGTFGMYNLAEKTTLDGERKKCEDVYSEISTVMNTGGIYQRVIRFKLDEEGNVLLSELTGGNIENCGLFSKLKKALKKVAVVVAVVAVAAVVVAAVAACPAVGVLVTTTGQTVLAVTGTIGSAALVSGALTTAVVAGTAALATYGLSQAIYDSYVEKMLKELNL